MHVADKAPGKSRRLKFHASQTASESSTIAEEVVVLLRRLHSLPAWYGLINQFISTSFQDIPSVILPQGNHTHTPLGPGQGVGSIKDQVSQLGGNIGGRGI